MLNFNFILTKLLAAFILLILIPISNGLISPVFLAVSIIFLQLGMILITKKFKPLAILFIFIFPYIFVAFPHFNSQNFPLTLAYTEFDNDQYYLQVLVIHSLFLSTVALFIPLIKTPFLLKDNMPVKKNYIIFYGLLCFMFLITIFGRSGNNIFDSGGYGSIGANVQNAGGLAIFEYFLVLFPIAYIYSGQNKKKLRLLLIMAVIYSLKGLLLGGRIEALQMLLMIFILYIDNKKLKLRKVIRLLIVPSLFFIVFGLVRSAPNTSFNELTILLLDVYENNLFIFFGHHIDIYYSTTRLYALVSLEIIDLSDRLYSFVLNIIAIVVPFSKLPDIANLTAFKKDIHPAGGGGLISVIFYVFFILPRCYINWIFVWSIN